VFEKFVKQRGIERHVVLRTPHFMSLPIIVAETDAVATVPQAVADFIKGRHGVVEIGLPFTPPTFQVNLFWHRSAQHDPANHWPRELLISKFPMLLARGYDRNGQTGRAGESEGALASATPR